MINATAALIHQTIQRNLPQLKLFLMDSLNLIHIAVAMLCIYHISGKTAGKVGEKCNFVKGGFPDCKIRIIHLFMFLEYFIMAF